MKVSVVGFHGFPSQVTGGFTRVEFFLYYLYHLISGIIFGNLERGNFSFAPFLQPPYQAHLPRQRSHQAEPTA
jgi:hypothetical protein